MQKLEQRASDLETQLSDALVDVQRRDATISELKAALQVHVVFVYVSESFNEHDQTADVFLLRSSSLLTRDFSGKRSRIEHLRGFSRQTSCFSALSSCFNCCFQKAVVKPLCTHWHFSLSSYFNAPAQSKFRMFMFFAFSYCSQHHQCTYDAHNWPHF